MTERDGQLGGPGAGLPCFPSPTPFSRLLFLKVRPPPPHPRQFPTPGSTTWETRPPEDQNINTLSEENRLHMKGVLVLPPAPSASPPITPQWLFFDGESWNQPKPTRRGTGWRTGIFLTLLYARQITGYGEFCPRKK